MVEEAEMLWLASEAAGETIMADKKMACRKMRMDEVTRSMEDTQKRAALHAIMQSEEQKERTVFENAIF